MKRGRHAHVQPGTQDQTPLNKESFAIGYALSSTQHFLGDFATSIQVSPHILASGVAALLSGERSGQPFRSFDNMPGLRGQTTGGDQAMEPLALAGGTYEGGPESLNGHRGGHRGGRRKMTGATKRRISERMIKSWAGRNGKLKRKGSPRKHHNGFWDAQIVICVGSQSFPRAEIYRLVHKKVGGDKSPVYPAVSNAIKKKLLIPDANDTFKVNEEVAAKAAAAAA